MGNEEITKSLLTSIIGKNITSINLDGNTILERDLLDDKVGILDVKAKLDSNIVCDIEIQVESQKNIDKRLMYYWSKLYSNGINRGTNYIKLKKTISILIAKFEMKQLREIEKFHTEWKIQEKDYRKIVLTDVFELHIIELPKLEKIIGEGKLHKEDEKLAIWSRFLLNPDNMEDAVMNDNEDVKKAKEELEKMRQDEYEERIAELRLKAIMDRKAIEAYWRDEGFEEGEKNASIKIAKKLLSSGMPLEEIMEITKLTKEEIEEN